MNTAATPEEIRSASENTYPIQRDPSFSYRNHYPRLAPSVPLEGLIVSVDDKMIGYQGGSGTNTTFYYENLVMQAPDGLEHVFVNPGPSTLQPQQYVALLYAPFPTDFTFSDLISLYSECGVICAQRGILQGEGIITQYQSLKPDRAANSQNAP